MCNKERSMTVPPVMSVPYGDPDNMAGDRHYGINWDKRNEVWHASMMYLGVNVCASAKYHVNVDAEMYHAQMQIALEFGHEC
jgi:hypothetical protein